jgi:hypothetical protein
MLRIYINCLISCVFEGINILVCRVESWILHGVPRAEKGCGILVYRDSMFDSGQVLRYPFSLSRPFLGPIQTLSDGYWELFPWA